jgi:hypothetical protein
MTTPTLSSASLSSVSSVVLARRVRVVGDLFHGRVPAGAIYVGRPAPGLPGSRYANPHKLGHCRACEHQHTAIGVIAAYGHHLDQHPDLVATARAELAGRDLACWCRPTVPCHVDVLIERITRPTREPGPVDGTCPACGAVYGLDEGDLLPGHRIPPSIGQPVCPGTGQPATETHPQPAWFVEGVSWL